MKKIGEYEICNCDPFDGDGIEYMTAVCGCGERHARLYRDHVIHWMGKHWVIECAFKEAVRRLEVYDDESRASGEANRDRQI